MKMEAEGFSETLGDDSFARYTVLYPGRQYSACLLPRKLLIWLNQKCLWV